MTATPIIEVFPEENLSDELNNVRSALLAEDNQMHLAASLRALGATALIITPEYNESRAKDTGRELVLHVLLDGKITELQMFSLEDKVKEILGEEGFAVSFDRDHIPALPLYLTGDNGNPFRKMIERVSGVLVEGGRVNPK